MDPIYVRYSNYVDSILSLPNLPNFKSNDDYEYMLEHTSPQQGYDYFELIRSKTNLSEEAIRQFCETNDRIGGGKKYNYGLFTTSPSNFRYIFHAHLILAHMVMSNITNVNIVEVGGGYGGLCLAISAMCNNYGIRIKSYSIIDLPAPNDLQKRYLAHHRLNFPTNFYSAFNYGSEVQDDNNFLISSYCFSEISSEHQSNYIKTLFPKIQHGFMAWNNIPLYNFGFTYKEEVEYPLTGSVNKYVYF